VFFFLLLFFPFWGGGISWFLFLFFSFLLFFPREGFLGHAIAGTHGRRGAVGFCVMVPLQDCTGEQGFLHDYSSAGVQRGGKYGGLLHDGLIAEFWEGG
jgi:hypothetical protein